VSERLTDERLTEIWQITDAATQGPWRRCGANDGECPCGVVWSTEADCPVLVGLSREHESYTLGEGVTREQSFKNSDFAVAARDFTPELLDEIAALKKQLATCQRVAHNALVEQAEMSANHLALEASFHKVVAERNALRTPSKEPHE
jgi:hypothetical protein